MGIPDVNIVFIQDSVSDFLGIQGSFTGPDNSFWSIVVQLRDSTGNAFTNTDFPMSLSLMDFDAFDGSNSGTLASFLGTGGVFEEGPLLSLQLRPVPVPPTLWLLFSAFVLLSRIRR